MMSRRHPRLVALGALALLSVGLACACGGGGRTPGAGTATSTSGGSAFSIGEIKRLPGGTAVPTDARTLVSAVCSDGRLALKTDRESVVGEMDCNRMIPSQVVDKFRGKPIAVSYNGQRLRIESATEGTVEITVENASVGAGDASP